jgi:hypothetical protein
MASTVSYLERTLQKYVRPDEDFLCVLNMALPRLYSLGYWKDLIIQEAQSTNYPYFTLPRSAESVIAISVDDVPTQLRSLWHDFRIAGPMPGGPPHIFGAVDDGLHATVVDLDKANNYGLRVRPVSPYTTLPNEGRVDVELVTDSGAVKYLVFPLDGTTSLRILTPGTGNYVSEIRSISFVDVPREVEVVVEPANTALQTLTVGSGRGTEVARYRRFRINNETLQDRIVFMLLKRRFEVLMNQDDIVYLDNINALKHSILGTIAEDNADIERANYHWGVCNLLLDQEKDAHRGMVRPTLKMDPTGQSGYRVPNLF